MGGKLSPPLTGCMVFLRSDGYLGLEYVYMSKRPLLEMREVSCVRMSSCIRIYVHYARGDRTGV